MLSIGQGRNERSREGIGLDEDGFQYRHSRMGMVPRQSGVPGVDGQGEQCPRPVLR
ncbi:MAG: hypothetical protein U0T81_19730 [Saprospiraceae bacterium]